MSDATELWRELRALGERIGNTERDVAQHLGECSARHAEIQRRFEEAARNRGELRTETARDATRLQAEIDKTAAKVDALRNRITGLAITIALATTALVVQIVLQSTKVLK